MSAARRYGWSVVFALVLVAGFFVGSWSLIVTVPFGVWIGWNVWGVVPRG